MNLFPLLLRLVPPDAPQLPSQLAALRDPEGVWSPHGLRSLSMGSTLYKAYNTEHDGPYWRGPIWINLNYLALAALQHYAQVTLGPCSVANVAAWVRGSS